MFFNLFKSSSSELVRDPNRELFTLYSDCHIGVPPQRNPELINITEEQIKKENAYSLGDNFEIKNCEKQDLFRLEKAYAEHKKKFAGRFVSGNHEVQGYSNDYTVVVTRKNGTKILFVHGDIPLWGNSKAFDFRTKGKGGGFSWINKTAMNNHGSVNKSESKELAAYAKKYGADTIVVGHTHPSTLLDIMVNGVRVINVPRGKTQIYL